MVKDVIEDDRRWVKDLIKDLVKDLIKRGNRFDDVVAMKTETQMNLKDVSSNLAKLPRDLISELSHRN